MRMTKLLDKKFLYFGGTVGLIAILIYDVIGSIIIEGYSQIIHAVSDLTQVGAENIFLLSSIFLVAGLMLVVFAIELARPYKFEHNKLLFLGSIILSSLGLLLLVIIFPMVPFKGGATFPGEIPVILAGLNIVILIMVIPLMGICLYIEKKWNSFRLYSIVTVLIMGTFGSLTSLLMMNNIELLGLFKRITIYVYQFWIFILAVLLIDEKKKVVAGIELFLNSSLKTEKSLKKN